MKKLFKSYFAIWAVLLVLFNIIAFVSAGWTGQEKYTSSFWVGYVSITIAFLGQLACTNYALKNDDPRKTFFSLSLFSVGRAGLIMTFVFGGLCMLISTMPYWAGTILCAATLAFNAIAIIKTATTTDIVTDTEERLNQNTTFIRSLTLDAEGLLKSSTDEGAKSAIKKVYEAVRYSDPVSSTAFAPLENEIKLKFADLTEAVNQNEPDKIVCIANEITDLLAERSRNCKMFKS